MENASKALLMAGGMLLVMLIIGLLIFAWGRFSDFYNQNDELAEIEDLSKFNLQFTNFEKRNVYGYELISLANKIADYNMRYSNVNGSQNDEKYTPITMTVNLKGKAEAFNFGTINDGIRNYKTKENSFFAQYNTKNMVQSTTRNDITNIITEVTGVENFYRDASTTSKLAKSINELILTKEQIEYNKEHKHMTENESKNSAVDNYKNIVKSDVDITYDQMVYNLTHEGNILKYYEYIQFKKGIFECIDITDNDYDKASGRIKLIQFEFTGTIE